MTVWSFLIYLTGWPLVLLLFIGGLYFTIRTKCPQFRLFFESIRVINEKPSIKGSISSFGALMVSTASRVGTGNIVGVSAAICMGGPGAVFWMWFCAIIGGASALVESTLAQIYKRRKLNGDSYGGPAYYIETVLHNRILAIAFVLALIFTYAVGYNMLASYNIQSVFSGYNFYNKEFATIIGAIIALLFLYTILGGGNRLIKVTCFLVPIMGFIYVLLSIVALVLNFHNVPSMFAIIFKNAFDFKAIFGGFSGSCLMYGFKRGLFSNEAGMGSAPNAAASANVSHPIKQGLVQMFSVFIDTIVICSATAFMCLSSGVEPANNLAGAPFIQLALSKTFGTIGPIFVIIAMLLFGFTTLLGNFYYVENGFDYLWQKAPNKNFMLYVRLVGALLVFLGAIVPFDFVWSMADVSQFLLASINIPVCILLGSVVYKALDNYVLQKRNGNKSKFNAKRDAGVKENTDFWN